jgi:hypothetical protein
MADLGDSGKGKATAATGKNDAPKRQALLRHMRGTGGRAMARKVDEVEAAARLKQATEAFEREEAAAQSLLAQAGLLAVNTAIPQPLRDDFAKTKRVYDVVNKKRDVFGARTKLGDHSNAARNLVNGAKGLELKKEQLIAQATLFDEMAPVLDSVKKSSFREGQAALIGKQDLSAGTHFKAYLSKLAALEAKKAAGQKVTAKGGSTGLAFSGELKTLCIELIAAAEAHLTHYEQDLNPAQKNEKSSLSKKRYCEEGRLAARQYMMALDFDAIPDPRSPLGWSDEDQMRAATVRAQVNYHETYQTADKMGEGAGASESRWLQGADWKAESAAKAGSLRTDDDGLNLPTNQRVAIFKAAVGETAPDGMNDKKGAGAIKEALASANAKLFATQTGIDLGVPETNVVAIHRYELSGGGPEKGRGPDKTDPNLVIGSSQQSAGAKDEVAEMAATANTVRELIKTVDVQKIAMLDIMSLNCDRHAGNLMLKPGTDGAPTMVPIDHGGSMPSRADFETAKGRIAGVAADGSIVNELLQMPSAYEPFDPQLLEQLDLLDPAAIEVGMKRQLAAMDAVHPGFDAAGKVPDSGLHMSKRAMMFMKRAARFLSPAEIQIALGQNGPALFDIDDAGFDVAADQVIAAFVPLKEAYKEVLTGPMEQRQELIDWLQSNGWVQLHCERNFKEWSGAEFLMKNPELALKLFRSKTPNPSPPPDVETAREAATQRPKSNVTPPSEELKRKILADFPQLNPNPDSETAWLDWAFEYAQFVKEGGMAVYRTVLLRTGADQDSGIRWCVTAIMLWKRLNEAGNAALLQRLKPLGAGLAATEYLKQVLELGLNEASAARTLLDAQATAATLVDDLDTVVAGDLLRIRTLLPNPLAAAQAPVLAARADSIETGLLQGTMTADQAHADAMAVERQLRNVILDAIAAPIPGRAKALEGQTDDTTLLYELGNAKKDVMGACLNMRNLEKAGRALEMFDALDSKIQRAFAAEQQVIAKLPAFSWDADAASDAKRAAIREGFIRDKDTGMSDALKSVASAAKDFQAVLGSKVKPEKKRPAGEKGLAAYTKFIDFVERKLRPLAATEPPSKAWTAYCNGAVSEANKKIAFIKSLMANWP